jgi:hypothetical protein
MFAHVFNSPPHSLTHSLTHSFTHSLINLFVCLFYLSIRSVRLEKADVSYGCLQDPVGCAMRCLYLLHLLHIQCLSVRISCINVVRPWIMIVWFVLPVFSEDTEHTERYSLSVQNRQQAVMKSAIAVIFTKIRKHLGSLVSFLSVIAICFHNH